VTTVLIGRHKIYKNIFDYSIFESKYLHTIINEYIICNIVFNSNWLLDVCELETSTESVIILKLDIFLLSIKLL
jgi:hypothetical protein